MWAAAMPAGSHPKESFGNDLHSAGRVPRRCLPGSWRCQVRRGSAHGEGRMSRLVTWNAIEYLRSIFSRRYRDNWLIDDKFSRCLECRLNVFFVWLNAQLLLQESEALPGAALRQRNNDGDDAGDAGDARIDGHQRLRQRMERLDQLKSSEIPIRCRRSRIDTRSHSTGNKWIRMFENWKCIKKYMKIWKNMYRYIKNRYVNVFRNL